MWVLQVGGSVEVCRVTISSYLSVRVGSGYRVEYYFIYFPVAVQNTGKRVVPPTWRTDHTLPCVLYRHGEIDEVVLDSIARADSY